jgi:RNA polymerase sigma-70 factor (ECF subfamily)
MAATHAKLNESWEGYRSYLRLLARVQLPANLRGKIDPSDIVQQTLLCACRANTDLRDADSAVTAAWLRQILRRQLLDIARAYSADKRQVLLERSLDEPAAQLDVWLARSGSSPSQKLSAEESLLALSRALERLPDDQRLAVELRYFSAQSVAEIAAQLDRSPAAVAGLLRRGLTALRADLAQGAGRER